LVGDDAMVTSAFFYLRVSVCSLKLITVAAKVSTLNYFATKDRSMGGHLNLDSEGLEDSLSQRWIDERHELSNVFSVGNSVN
jgi:hypothetical protein